MPGQTASCTIHGCAWEEDFDDGAWGSSVLAAARCRATWHIWEDHPDVWQHVIGYRLPLDPDPRTDDGKLRIIARTFGEVLGSA